MPRWGLAHGKAEYIVIELMNERMNEKTNERMTIAFDVPGTFPSVAFFHIHGFPGSRSEMRGSERVRDLCKDTSSNSAPESGHPLLPLWGSGCVW